MWTDPAGVSTLLAIWTEKLAGGPQLERLDPPPPLARVRGLSGQHQQAIYNIYCYYISHLSIGSIFSIYVCMKRKLGVIYSFIFI